jgi:hypothetical protein
MRIIFVFLAIALLARGVHATGELAAHVPPEPDAMHVEGRDGWRFLPAELRHHMDKETPPDAEEAVIDTSRQLATLGIQLVVVPVPTKLSLYPEKLAEGLTVPTTREKEFIASLRENGVEVIDLFDDFAASDAPTFCLRDSHWNGSGLAIAADRITEEIAVEIPGTTKFQADEQSIEIEGDLGGEKETVTLTTISPYDKDAARASPVLVIGDSNALVFHEGGDMHARHAGLSDLLALRLGSPVDLLAVRGSGATTVRVSLARRARTNPDWLKDKRIVIWVFAIRELTEAKSWDKIPLLP